MAVIIVVIAGLLIFDILAATFGVDSRDRWRH
jgi:hypothetical protein